MRRLSRLACLVYPLLLPPPVAPAMEPDSAPADPAPPPVSRFFDHPIDYWRSGDATLPGAALFARPGAREERPLDRRASHEWGERIRLPDGTLAFQELPEPLVLVLEDPSSENIRAYFEWRQRRIRKILLAADRMQVFRNEHPAVDRSPSPAPRADSVPESAAPAAQDSAVALAEDLPAAPEARPPEAVRMIYFHRSGCSHCDDQDRILAAWLRAKSGLTVELIEWGSKLELWAAYRVRGTPSIAFEGPGSRRFLQGLTGPAELDRALDEVRTAMPGTGARRGAGGP